eukprot:2075030-Rhodomonas_salina.2
MKHVRSDSAVNLVGSPICLRAPYAVSGMLKAYGATKRIKNAMPYAVSGTDPAHGATRKRSARA